MKLFQDILIPAQVFVGGSFGIFKAFQLLASNKPDIIIKDPIVDVSFLWAFIDGASKVGLRLVEREVSFTLTMLNPSTSQLDWGMAQTIMRNLQLLDFFGRYLSHLVWIAYKLLVTLN